MNQSKQNEEEYQFQSINNLEDLADVEKKSNKAAVFERIRRNHIIAVVLVLLSGWGIYKIVDKLLPLPKEVRPSHLAKTPLSTKSNSPPVINTATAMEVSSHHLAKLEASMLNLQASLERLTAQMGDMQTSLANVDSKLANLSDTAQQLSTQQQQWLSKQLTQRKKPPAIKKSTLKPIYYVRAIVPGRAWLIAQDGSTLTIGVGDSVAGYGSVQLIDPNQGIVTLSSGAIIGFNPNDS